MGRPPVTERVFSGFFNTESILAHKVGGQTEAVHSNASIEAIVDSGGSVGTGSPPRSARLGAGPGWIRVRVLSMGDPEARVIGLSLDVLDDLNRVRGVGIGYKHAVPGDEAISMQPLQ